MLCTVLGLVLYMTIFIDANPLALTSTTTNLDDNRLLKYLIKYGYLFDRTKTVNTFVNKNGTMVQVNTTTTPTYDKDEISSALKDMQTFMRIPQTGQIDVETINVLNRPRCGEKDRVPKDRKSPSFKIFLTPRGRRKRRDALKYFYRNTYSKGVTYDWKIEGTSRSSVVNLRILGADLIEFGLNRWASVSNVNFQNRNGWAFADINIHFYKGYHGDGQPFDGPGGELAHASSTSKEIHLDDDEKWLYHQIHAADFRRTGKMPDFVQTIIHETGHVLGLTHSSNNESVMFPTIYSGPDGSNYALHQEDINRVQKVYGRCWPEHINAVFCNYRGDGKTYLNVGPYIYQFNNAKVQVAQSWPRAAFHFFRAGFNLFETIFHNTDGMLYFVWEGWYYWDYGALTRYWYRVGKARDSNTIGWPGLKEETIDAAFLHADGKLYIFRKDLVYRWDEMGPSPVIPHFPLGSVEKGWPKKISAVFPGLPNDIDSAFHWNYDGNVYFFKGKYFYIWDKNTKKVLGQMYSTDQWKNLCDMITCGTSPCRSWALNKQNCAFCPSK